MEKLAFCISGIQVDMFIQTYNDSRSTMSSNCCFVKMNITQKKGDSRENGMFFSPSLPLFLGKMIKMKVWLCYFYLVPLICL